jgi:hypothetical protein
MRLHQQGPGCGAIVPRQARLAFTGDG